MNHLAIDLSNYFLDRVGRKMLVLLAAILITTSLSAQEASMQAPKPVAQIEGISEYKLENGVRVLLFPDPSKELVTVNMTIFVGSRHEGYGEAGMAHLLEHMLFKGTPARPNIPQLLQDRGATFNGTTWMDRTNYYETLPATEENLDFAIALEADRLLNSNILGEDLESEMTVVRNEFERGENSPSGVLMQRIQSAAYDWHNYGQSTIGNRSDIERVPVVRLRRFYKKYYRPDNVMLVVAGKFDTERTLEMIQEHFGSLTRPETPIDGTYTTEPAQDGERTVVLRRVGDVPWVGAAYHIPGSAHEDFAAMKILTYVLGDKPSGRLYTKLVETGMASNVYAMANAFHDPGLFMTLVQIPADASIEAVRTEMLEIIETDLQQNPITDKEVDRARQQILKNRELQATNSDKIAVSLSEWAAQGDWRLYFLFRDRIENMTTEEVQAAAKKYFTRNNRTVGLFIPSEKSDRIEIPTAPNLSAELADYKGREVIEQGEAFDPDPAVIEQRTERGTLSGDIQYAFLPKKTRGGSVNMKLTLRFGNETKLADKIAASELLGILMARGTTDLTYSELQDQLTSLRADLSIHSVPGLLTVDVSTTKEFVPEVIALVGKVLRSPSLSADELEVLRRQIVTSLEASQNEPQALAPTEVRRKLSPYSSDNVRYVRTIPEEIQMYKDVTIEQIRELYEGYIGNHAGEVVMVGDFDPEQAAEQWGSVLDDWAVPNRYERFGRPAHPEVPGSVTQIETPDKSNAMLFAQQQYELMDDDERYPALLMGNFILGGGSLSSRLADRVRQQDGLSYTIRSMVSGRKRDDRTDFTLYAITNPENKDKLLVAIREEIAKVLEEGVTEDELARAKKAYLDGQRVQRTNDKSLTSTLMSTIFNQRTMDHYQENEASIEALTVDQVNAALREFIDVDKLVIAVAGDFQKAAEAPQPEK